MTPPRFAAPTQMAAIELYPDCVRAQTWAMFP
jgi:hypothetical protein